MSKERVLNVLTKYSALHIYTYICSPHYRVTREEIQVEETEVTMLNDSQLGE